MVAAIADPHGGASIYARDGGMSVGQDKGKRGSHTLYSDFDTLPSLRCMGVDINQLTSFVVMCM